MIEKPAKVKVNSNFSLSEEFAIISFLILFAGAGLVSWWLDREIKQTVFEQTVQTTRLFVDSFYSSLVKELAISDQLNPDSLLILESLDQNSPIGEQFAFLKIWSKSGKLAYSSDPSIIGGKSPLAGNVIRAGKDQVNWQLYQPQELKDKLGIDFKHELLKIVLPIHLARSDHIVAVAEIYFYTEQLRNTIFKSQMQSLALVFFVNLLTFVLLYGIVRKGNQTIWTQQNKLQMQIKQLSELLDQNEQLHVKVRTALFNTSEVSEKLLRRISAELHDSPAQNLGYALLRLDSIRTTIKDSKCHADTRKQLKTELDVVQTAAAEALKDIRDLSSQLSMPTLENMNLEQVIQRVINLHQRRTNTQVVTDLDQVQNITVPMAIMIGVYRFVQEALNNAYRHGNGANQQVKLELKNENVMVEVSDQGPGFDINLIDFTKGHLGLIGIRERIESLGGSFLIQSSKNQGTTLSVSIPLTFSRESYGKQDQDSVS